MSGDPGGEHTLYKYTFKLFKFNHYHHRHHLIDTHYIVLTVSIGGGGATKEGNSKYIQVSEKYRTYLWITTMVGTDLDASKAPSRVIP